MTQHDHDFDEFLRRVLREEADAVQPADDGLERIRARLTRPYPAPVAWVMAGFSGTGRRVQGTARSLSAWLQRLPGAAQVRLRWPRGGGSRSWRSPAVLAACAAIMVAVGVLALTPLPGQAVSDTAALFRSFTGGHGGGAAGQGGGQAEGGSGPQPASGAASGSPPGKRAHRSAASPSPSASPSPAPGSASPSSSAAASPSASPSPSPSPTPSCPSPSASPSPSPSPSPGSGACPSPSPTATGGPTTGPSGNPPPTPDPAPDPG